MLLLLLACAMTPPAPEDPAPLVPGVEDPQLARLLHEHWEAALRREPEWASMLGDRRFDHLVFDPSVSAWQAELAYARDLHGRALALQGLDGEDALTRELLLRELQHTLDEAVCAFPTWSLRLYDNPVSGLTELPELHDFSTPEAAAPYLARLAAAPAAWDARGEALREGLAKGRVANAETTRRMIALVDGLLATPAEDHPLLAPARAEALAAWPEAERAAFAEALARSVQEGVTPALGRYRRVLAEEVLPRAREGRDVGLTGLPEGAACYASQIRRQTTLDRSPEDIHALGLAELARIHEGVRALGRALWGLDTLADIQARLREDEAMHFGSAEEVLAVAEQTLARAQAAVPGVLGRLPAAPCEVHPVPALIAPYTTIAYYKPPGQPGEPGEYRVNTHAPHTRTRYEAEALAFHEAVPGHHLQIALATERPDAPPFRRNLSLNVYVEGWALYAERLADELGLYSGPLDRLGALSFDAWRASRLVVDTGIHHLGWSREQAVDFMLANTLLAPNNVDNEVDRYIAWPAQALGYKLGQIELLALREEARAALGEAFVLSDFHDLVLGGGPLPLDLLRLRVEAWVAAGGGPP